MSRKCEELNIEYTRLGLATSFYNEKNRNVAHDLANLIVEANQELPDWLENVASATGGAQRSMGRSRPRCTCSYLDLSALHCSGGGFGGRDYRAAGGGGGSRGGYVFIEEAIRDHASLLFVGMVAATAVE